jgi:uncharacterized pyridoxal phosphate-containing UPF0001 family protein
VLAAAGRPLSARTTSRVLAKIDALRDLPPPGISSGSCRPTRPTAAERLQRARTPRPPRVAERLSGQRPHHAPPLEVLIQVKLVDEAAKGGVTPAQLPALASAVAALPRLKLRGLMCIPPDSRTEVEQRRPFRRLRELQDGLNAAGHRLVICRWA